MKSFVSAAVARSLIDLGVPTVHEAQGRRFLLDGPKLLVGPPFAGPAYTVAIPAGDNLGIHIALQQAAAGAVICVASRGAGVFGVIGELMVTAARAHSIAALVIDDGIRDINELAAPPSIAARGVCARGTIKRRALAVDEPVDVGAVLIRPGDWIVGDADGVCVVPAAAIDGVLERAASRTRKERGIRAELERGLSTVEALGLTELMQEALNTR